VSSYLRVSDVAEDVGVSPRTVLRWVARGELPALRLPGGRLRISQTAYSAWVDANTTTDGRRTLVDVDEGGE
jgi:excisionase family DNA binding protein